MRPQPTLRDIAVQMLEREGVAAAWDRYWRPLFGPYTPESVVAEARSMALEQDVASLVRGVRAFHDRRDNGRFIAQWAGPLVAISGSFDHQPPPSEAIKLGIGERRSVYVIEGCGHYVNLEQPSVFRPLLARLLQQGFDQ